MTDEELMNELGIRAAAHTPCKFDLADLCHAEAKRRGLFAESGTGTGKADLDEVFERR